MNIRGGSSTKLYGLDTLRALAITLVFFYHYRMFSHPAWVDEVAGFGWTGVDLFFVLSGYLISSQLLKNLELAQPHILSTFFIKRFFRIIPLYVFIVALYFLAPAFREREALPPLWKFLTFTQNFGLDVIHKGTFSHAWSLCIEEQFYITLPFILLLCYKFYSIKRVNYFLPLLLLLALCIRILSWQHFVVPAIDTDNFWLIWYKWIYYPTYTRLDGLLVGGLIAFILHFAEGGISYLTGKGYYFLGMAITILIAAFFICKDQYTFSSTTIGFLLVALGYGFLVLAAISPGTYLYSKNLLATRELAALSYAIYLSHKGVIHITQLGLKKAGMNIEHTGALLICALSCIVAGYLLRFFIEKPFYAIRDYLLAKMNIPNTVNASQN